MLPSGQDDPVERAETEIVAGPEMQEAVGIAVLADKFDQSVFRESLRRAFERLPDPPGGNPAGSNQLQMGFGGQIEVIHSREFKIAGAIGPCASLKKAGPGVSENEMGVG